MSAPCPNCARLREEIAQLRRELAYEVDLERVEEVRVGFEISPQEAQVLMGLYHAKGRALSHDQMLDTVPARGGLERESGKIPAVYVSRLRRRLGEGIINTVWGRGYRLTPEGVAVVETVSPRRPA